ncbi:hypothetical protein NTCA1_12760 [Novosphingobium sp. TCA1]|jgi:hypothetical protein|uniref:Anti-sigma factor NepR domain-containing protein n=1 Tax=Novosphingobium pentaromativorans TaxID=205844 RepID=A0A2W5NPG6_9SPHN|nr:MAG: hypothetical protein DI555_08640 [Novosphingobium pentaromativorans]GFE73627.1 hypothetical protein NTCA1_12760 [Novosphingobium sp. TCA1]
MTLDPLPASKQVFRLQWSSELNQPDGQGAARPIAENSGDAARPGLPPDIRRDGEPGWAGGLRKLYNSVVDEPLPDSFKDLLKKLDGADDA